MLATCLYIIDNRHRQYESNRVSRRKQQARGGNRLFIRMGFAQLLEFRFLFTVKIRGGGDKDSGKGESKTFT